MITTLQVVLLAAIILLVGGIVVAHRVSVRKAEQELAASRRNRR